MRDLIDFMNKSLEERRKLNRTFVNERLKENQSNNAKLIVEEAKELCGNYVDYFGCQVGYLLGATCGHDDYYWMYIDKNLKICYSSCVSNPTKLNEMPNNDFSVLNYLIETEPESIIEKVKDSFTRCDDVMFTPLYINGKEYKIDA